MRIMVDFDGVIADIHHHMLDLMKLTCDIDLKYKDWDDMHYFNQLGHEKEFWEAYDLLRTPRFMKAVELVERCIPNIIHAWQLDFAHEVEVVTCSREEDYSVIYDWLERNGIFVELRTIGRVSGREKLKEPLYDVYIEDSPSFFEAVLNYIEEETTEGTTAPVWQNREFIVYSRPWNASLQIRPYNFTRVRSWRGVEARVRQIARRNKW